MPLWVELIDKPWLINCAYFLLLRPVFRPPALATSQPQFVRIDDHDRHNLRYFPEHVLGPDRLAPASLGEDQEPLGWIYRDLHAWLPL